MTQTSGLTVRQHEREALELSAEFVVCEQHREQVRFSAMSGAAEPHVTRGIATDISLGGMGLVCGQFGPRMCEGTVRVFDPDPVGEAPDGTPLHEVMFEHRAKIRRVALAGHEPSYALGAAFIDPEPDIEQRIAKVLEAAVRLGEEGGGDDA